MAKEVVIVGIARTPIGSYGKALAPLTAPQLGAHAIKSAVARAGIKPEDVEEVFFGNVLSAAIGQAPARQATLGAGLPHTVPATTVNKVCASGTKATMFAAQNIMLGQGDIIVAGGMESMSNTPYYVPKARFGYRMGDGKLIDGMVHDGLWDAYNNYHMGMSAEKCASDHGFSREDQDAYAMLSYRRAKEATDNGNMKNEVAPIEVPGRKGSVTISEDEEFSQVNFDKLPALKPAFKRDGGTVTAANASSLNDGAAALVLMSREKADELGLKPLARIRSMADAAKAPEDFTTAPTPAMALAFERAGVQAGDIDYFEINEAFSVVTQSNAKNLGLKDYEKVNVFGGAVSLGHPIGCSGARIIVTLLNVLQTKDATLGAVGICNGGGGASAMVIERI